MTSPTTARVEPKLEDVDLDYTTTIVPETTTFTNQNTSSTSHRPQVQPSRGYEPSVESVSASEDHPLAGYSMGQLAVMGELYAYDHGMEAHSVDFQKGAILAANPEAFKHTSLFTEEDKEVLEREKTHKWSHPVALYHMVIMCSMAAVVQGMDETVINGAQLFFRDQFGINGGDRRSELLLGLVNSAPYLCCAVLGCWLNDPLNKYFGRRHTIFLTCFISFATCLSQSFTNTWQTLFIARFLLGLGLGPKSSTIPVYAAECSPPAIRGALVMMWQMWTAFGIMIGFVADAAFYGVKDSHGIVGLNWRLMLGSACIPPIFVCAQVYFCPESPRWYMKRGQHRKAFEALSRLRWTKMQAARDIFYMNTLLQADKIIQRRKNRYLEIFTVARNRRAMVASEITMFMQQFCGINVIAYYSAVIFVEGGFSEMAALLASLGFGVINFLFALPAVYTIDTFGRRNLLLTTFPLMGIFLFFTGFCFWIPDEYVKVKLGLIALGIYLFTMVYSPGEGPVPFTYSAEAYPLYVRDIGMSVATATTWGFNFVLSISWPTLQRAFKPQGAFAFYGTWNFIGFFLTLLFVRETKGRTLEELDNVFGISTRLHAAYGLRQIPYFINRFILRRKNVVKEKIYDHEFVVPKGTELVQMRSTGVSRARNGNTVTATVAGGRPADASAIERAEG